MKKCKDLQEKLVLTERQNFSFSHMEDSRLIELIREEIRQTRSLTLEVGRVANAAVKKADAALEEAKASGKKADAAWELVITTRKESRLPFWKKWFRIAL